MVRYFLGEPILLLVALASLVITITIHEFMHAFTADRLGDPTPRVQGRITLNPLKHLDPIGTLALLLVGFGWGKPVQFDPYNLDNPRRDAAIISFAGPASNMVMAAVTSVIFHLTSNSLSFTTAQMFTMFITINVILAIFNLIPIHPLDGGKILIGLLPRDVASDWDKILNQYGMFILLILILPIFGNTTLVSTLIGPTINFILGLLLP